MYVRITIKIINIIIIYNGIRGIMSGTCFFIGSRYSSDDLIKPLKQAIETHIIEYGVTDFTVGRYGNFDKLAQYVLREAKQIHGHIHLYSLAPYAMNQKGLQAPDGFDCMVYPDGLEKAPLRLAIIQANILTVKSSDYLIAHPGIGNSRNLVEYALKRGEKGLIKVTLI